MTKYDGINKAQAELKENEMYGLRNGYEEDCSFRKSVPAKTIREGSDRPVKGNLIARILVTVLLAAFVFLPKVFAYNGSDKVTDVVKTIVMTDITGSEKVGEGKIPDYIRQWIESLTKK